MQLSLLEQAVIETYAESEGAVDNKAAYEKIAEKLDLTDSQRNEIAPVGKAGAFRNLFHRKVRWVQQNLKAKKLLLNPSRGKWELIKAKKDELHAIEQGKSIIAMSTSLGMALCSRNESVFEEGIIDEPVHLVLTSPPYPLRIARNYGNKGQNEYVEWLMKILEPIVNRLADGGSIVLNISNDIFLEKSPARSTYWHRLVIALEDELGLYLMDTVPWVSNKIPTPVQWASKNRYQMNATWEPCLWFTNNPLKSFANNQRVLQPHTEQHKKLMQSGGLKKQAVHGDGAYRKPVGAFGSVTEGKIQRNVLNISNYCKSGRAVSKAAKEAGLNTHGAKMPRALSDFWIKYLTEPDMLVVDPFYGTGTTGESAQLLGRRWIGVEMIWEYLKQSFTRFDDFLDTWINPKFANAF